MNVEIGAEAALFLEKEFISGIFIAVQSGIGMLSGNGLRCRMPKCRMTAASVFKTL
jgi:hypothetical protein